MARGMKRPQGHRGLVDGGEGGGGGGGGGGITSVTSPDSSISVTNPAGPNVQIAVVPADSQASIFDLFLSFGHGLDIDARLPALTSFWFSPTAIADLARADQVREWVTEEALGFLGLVVRVDAAHLVTGGGSFIVTVNGLDTAISLAVPAGDTAGVTLATSALFAVAVGSRLGVRWDGSAAADGSTLRAEIRLRGALSGTPIIPEILPAGALALFRPQDLALDGTTWVDSVPGNVYHLAVPAFGPPPGGFQPITGPARINDGSFNGHPFARFGHYLLFGTDYTPNMLTTGVSMFFGGLVPIAARTIVAVCRPESIIGGLLAATQFGTHNFSAAFYNRPGHANQSVYFNQDDSSTGGTNTTCSMATLVSLAAQEVVLIWRTNGTTVEFFINGVNQPLATNLVGPDDGVNHGFCLGNLGAASFSSERGFRGDICFEGVWARRFTDAEVLSATSNLAGLYVTPPVII